MNCNMTNENIYFSFTCNHSTLTFAKHVRHILLYVQWLYSSKKNMRKRPWPFRCYNLYSPFYLKGKDSTDGAWQVGRGHSLIQLHAPYTNTWMTHLSYNFNIIILIYHIKTSNNYPWNPSTHVQDSQKWHPFILNSREAKGMGTIFWSHRGRG